MPVNIRSSALASSVLLLVVALAVRLLIVAAPVPVQLDKTLPDDAYYYFLTARNIAQGYGPSVDQLHPSNGWHPLWMVLMVGVFALPAPDLDTPVRVALALGALFDSLVVVVLYQTIRRSLGSPAAFAGALVYALNSMPLIQSVNGLETGLTALLTALAWMTTLRLIEQPGSRRALLWGLIFGLCFLARTDSSLILIWLGLFAGWRLLRTPGGLRLVTAGAVLALLVILPWFLWNQANFGSFLTQTSSIAVPWAARTRFALAQPTGAPWQESLRILLLPQYWLRGDYLGAPVLVGFVLWPLALVGLVRGLRSSQRGLAVVALLLAAGGLTLVLVHTLVRWYPRPWYFVVMAQSLSLGLAFLWWRAGARLRLGLAALGLPLLVISGWMAWQVGYYPWQRQLQYDAALWVRDHTEPDARIASMNSGVIGYYGERNTVNLDGVVNPQAFEAIQAYRLLPFMQEAGVDYFVDVDFALEGEYGVFMGPDYADHLTEVAIISEPYPGLGSIRAYAVEPLP